MPKYKVLINGEEQDEIFDTKSEAKEEALYMISCMKEGAETLHMSNPGDYPLEDEEYDYEIIKIDD